MLDFPMTQRISRHSLKISIDGVDLAIYGVLRSLSSHRFQIARDASLNGDVYDGDRPTVHRSIRVYVRHPALFRRTKKSRVTAKSHVTSYLVGSSQCRLPTFNNRQPSRSTRPDFTAESRRRRWLVGGSEIARIDRTRRTIARTHRCWSPLFGWAFGSVSLG
jgi:hypothetical protein